MNEVEKCNLAIENFKNIQELIRFIDQKTNFILIIIGFLITVFLELSTEFIFVHPNKYFGFKCFLSWTILISGSLFVVSIIGQFYIILFKIVISRKAKINNKKYNSLFYSEEITKQPLNNFINNFKTASDKKILNSILSQVYEVATIFNIKCVNYQKSIKILISNIFFLLVYILSGSLFLSI
ncbi:hypothetical protein [Fusobacterium sp. HC1336]|uniref:hypothetical protein n=1 Tax=Fusobacterium sp. HC1336 TaxID=3171169 RepID=UPI003F2290F2